MINYCNEDCYPCCDYCIYLEKKIEFKNNDYISVVNAGCSLFEDEMHQQLAIGSHYCRDFHCKYAERKGQKK